MGWGKWVESAVSIVHTKASGQELEGHVLSWHYWQRLSSSVLNYNASPPLLSEGWCHSFLCQPTSCKQICNTNQHTLLCVATCPPRYTGGACRVFWRSEQVSAALLCPQSVQQCVSLFNNGGTAKGRLVARQWNDSGLFKLAL